MSKILPQTDMFLLNYSYLFWGPLFYGTQCTYKQLYIHYINENNSCTWTGLSGCWQLFVL